MEEKRKPLAQLVSTRLGLIGFGVVGGTWTSNQNCSGLDFLHLTRKLAPNQGWSWTANYLGGARWYMACLSIHHFSNSIRWTFTSGSPPPVLQPITPKRRWRLIAASERHQWWKAFPPPLRNQHFHRGVSSYGDPDDGRQLAICPVWKMLRRLSKVLHTSSATNPPFPHHVALFLPFDLSVRWKWYRLAALGRGRAWASQSPPPLRKVGHTVHSAWHSRNPTSFRDNYVKQSEKFVKEEIKAQKAQGTELILYLKEVAPCTIICYRPVANGHLGALWLRCRSQEMSRICDIACLLAHPIFRLETAAHFDHVSF